MKRFILVLCKLNFCGNFGVKARIIAERKLMRIALIRINLRSLRSTILRSFHARNYHKNLVYRALIPLFCLFVFFVSMLDRRLFKANHGFCLHVIEAPIPSLPDPNPMQSFPQELFNQPFHYLGKGAQSFVFESQDGKAVLKFYRFPSHLRRFPWTHHPLGYLFSSSRKNIKEYNLRRLELSFHSFYLAANPLIDETAVLYVHLQPTNELHQKAHLIDQLGVHYDLPLDSVAFLVQKRGVSFLTLFKEELAKNNHEKCKQMLDGLIDVIRRRCAHNISDLDNMDNDNYGWLDGRAIHLDIGRFQEKESLSDPRMTQEEIMRIAHPLLTYLQATSPELHLYFLQIAKKNSAEKRKP